MNRRIPILLGFLPVILALWLLTTSVPLVRLFMERMDHIGYDVQLRTHLLAHRDKPAGIIGIIDIDDKSIQQEGHWPWSREKIANLVQQLQKQGAAVVAFDILLSEESRNIGKETIEILSNESKLTASTKNLIEENSTLFDQDKRLAIKIKELPTVLALSFLPRDQKQNVLPKPFLSLSKQQQQDLDIINAKGYISNIAILQNAAAGSGFINIFPDGDGIIRHAPLVMEYNGELYPALALEAVKLFLNEKIQLITPSYGDEFELEGINLGYINIPTNIHGEALIPFIGKSFTFPYYSATDILQGKVPNDDISGKILFIGTSATGLGDLKATAIQNPYPGVEVQATLANGMLQQNFSYIPAWTYGANIIITIIFGLIATLSFPFMGPRSLGTIIILLPTAMLVVNNWIWAETGLILSFVVPVILVMLMALLNILYGYLFESRKREHLKEMFGQYVPEKHIDEMLRSKDNFAMHGEDREMSVLFADIRSFTTISEGMSAEDLVEMLNTFFTPMTEIIFSHKGTIDKYVGDLIMAFWGAPLKDKKHAQHAVESAIEMQEKVKKIKPILKDKGWPEIQIGIGINAGHMSVGDMGSKYRRNYTVLGDAVNLASRVESLTKFYGVDIIVTESIANNQKKFTFRKLDKVAVKGKKEGIIIYEVVGYTKNIIKELQNEIDEYHFALDEYFSQNWSAALDKMNHLQNRYPARKIYSVYIDRINYFVERPPAAAWDGVFVHTNK